MTDPISEVRNLLCTLVAIPSVNSMGQTDSHANSASSGMVHAIERYLRDRGIRCRRQVLGTGEENLIAELIAGTDRPTIVFDAHTDTVPADDWLDRAFNPVIREGRLFGRGACDNKGGLTAMILALVEAHRRHTLANNVIFLASADEEFGRTGVQAFLQEGTTIDFAVIGEPTGCQPVAACKGAARWEIVVRGRSAHTGNPREGVNAISRMARVVSVLEQYDREVLANHQHALVSPPSIVASMISGGSAINVVPDNCRISVDLRTLPEDTPADAMAAAVSFLEHRCEFPIEHVAPCFWTGFAIAPDHPFVLRCLESCRVAAGSDEVVVRGVNYGCHASDYARCGIRAVIIGPGDIAVSHSVDECIDLSEVQRAFRIYLDLMNEPIRT